MDSDIVLWLKADSGITTPTNGSDVPDWTDEIQSNTIVAPTGEEPSYLENGLNFNPALDFVTGDRLWLDEDGSGSGALGIGAGAVDISLYTVFVPTDTSSNADRTVSFLGDI